MTDTSSSVAGDKPKQEPQKEPQFSVNSPQNPLYDDDYRSTYNKLETAFKEGNNLKSFYWILACFFCVVEFEFIFSFEIFGNIF